MKEKIIEEILRDYVGYYDESGWKDAIYQSDIPKASKEIADLDPWNYGDIPRDRAIERWHLMWGCPISVKYSTQTEHCKWIEKTLSILWPEEAFHPTAWMELPKAPKE